jgi:hypothetical protein
MALIFGMTKPNGLLQVTEIQYQKDSDPRGGHKVEADDIPEYPNPKPGIGYTMMFNPETSEFSFEETYRPHTTEEAILEVAAAMRELAQAIKEK